MHIAKKVIKVVGAIAMIAIWAEILSRIVVHLIYNRRLFPRGIGTSAWLDDSVGSIAAPGVLWWAFWLTLGLYLLWRIFWFVYNKRHPLNASRKGVLGFWLAIIFFIVAQLILIALIIWSFVRDVSLVHFDWAEAFSVCRIFLLYLTFVVPFSAALIFCSAEETQPFKWRKRSNNTWEV